MLQRALYAACANFRPNRQRTLDYRGLRNSHSPRAASRRENIPVAPSAIIVQKNKNAPPDLATSPPKTLIGRVSAPIGPIM
jgi:hypothetical protein